MDPNLPGAFLCSLLNRLEEPSSELKHLAAVSGQKDLFLKLNLWSTMLRIFMEAIFERENKKRLLSELEDKMLKVGKLELKTRVNEVEELGVKMWVDEVKELADDVEEILEEVSKRASRLKIMAQSGKKSSLQGLIPDCFTGSNTRAVTSFDGDSLISRIIDITSRLEKLNTERYALGLTVISRVVRCSLSEGSRTKTIYGRDEDKQKILEMVLRDEVSDHANFSVIPIIGTAGVGKTTLARLVYDDKEVEDFKPRAWVSLYEDSNVFRICKAILESITSKSCNLKHVDEVLVSLKKAIFGRKFLFVLDDVSTVNYDLWETLKYSFMDGATGSKILVTTRKGHIEFPVDLNIQPFTLEVLSDEACWSVFRKHAVDLKYWDLRYIREEVIDMCKGLPLAASILGGLIRFKQYDEWKCILNTKIWDLTDDSEILPVLKLSYQHLPLWLQRCFVYCAILPDHYEFEEKELVILWIAQEDEEMVCEQLDEDRGGKIFQGLLERSFFEHSSTHASKYRMHGLVKTMARWINGETNFKLEDVLEVNEQPECDEKNKFEFFVDNLRTFLPGLLCKDDNQHITDPVLSDLLPKFKELRALSLEKQNITQVPNSVECSRYLKYVNLSSTMIRTLPDSICSLLFLQILLLRDCSHLVELPSNLRKLIHLRCLDITGVNLLREMPLGMKELECLRTLLNFIVGKGVGSDLKDLENLKFVRELYISRLHNVTGSQDTKDSILIDKKGLKVLVLEWGSQLDDTRDELVEENVLDTLQPPQNLGELTIRGYGGTRFPSWVGDSTYSNLMVLTLERCEKCTVLPSLGWLGSLEHLTIKGMKRIGRIGSELFGEDCSTAFRSLKTLHFEDLPEWEHWDPVEENEHVEIFPRLRELSLVKCPKLRGKLPENPYWCSSKLKILECELLEVSLPSFPPNCDAEVDGCNMQCVEIFYFERYNQIWSDFSEKFLRGKQCLIRGTQPVISNVFFSK